MNTRTLHLSQSIDRCQLEGKFTGINSIAGPDSCNYSIVHGIGTGKRWRRRIVALLNIYYQIPGFDSSFMEEKRKASFVHENRGFYELLQLSDYELFFIFIPNILKHLHLLPKNKATKCNPKSHASSITISFVDPPRHKRKLQEKNHTQAICSFFQQKHPAGKDQTANAEAVKKAASATIKDLQTQKKKVVQGGAAEEAIMVCALCDVVCNSKALYESHINCGEQSSFYD